MKELIERLEANKRMGRGSEGYAFDPIYDMAVRRDIEIVKQYAKEQSEGVALPLSNICQGQRAPIESVLKITMGDASTRKDEGATVTRASSSSSPAQTAEQLCDGIPAIGKCPRGNFVCEQMGCVRHKAATKQSSDIPGTISQERLVELILRPMLEGFYQNVNWDMAFEGNYFWKPEVDRVRDACKIAINCLLPYLRSAPAEQP